MHELMWVSPLNSSLFISLEQRGSGFIRIFNQRRVFVPPSSPGNLFNQKKAELTTAAGLKPSRTRRLLNCRELDSGAGFDKLLS